MDAKLDVRSNQIRNDCICQKLQVVHIEDKLLEGFLRWFGHVLSQPIDAPVRRRETMESEVLEGDGLDIKLHGKKLSQKTCKCFVSIQT